MKNITFSYLKSSKIYTRNNKNTWSLVLGRVWNQKGFSKWFLLHLVHTRRWGNGFGVFWYDLIRSKVGFRWVWWVGRAQERERKEMNKIGAR